MQHDLKNDLESSVYVLLWVALACSPVSNPNQAAMFLRNTLDHQPCGPTGDYSKAHFLITRTFLRKVKFLGCPALDELIDELAYLLSVRYVTPPTISQRNAATEILLLTQRNDNSIFWDVYHDTFPFKFDQQMAQLADHEGVIKLFNDALSDHLIWPNDPPAKQDFDRLLHQRVVKTGWSTTIFFEYPKMMGNLSQTLTPRKVECTKSGLLLVFL